VGAVNDLLLAGLVAMICYSVILWVGADGIVWQDKKYREEQKRKKRGG
jgi:hypothetical protein